jgi:hypothetical protein
MDSFFQGWYRKIGLMTLLLALVFVSGWVRSFITGDYVTFPVRKQKADAGVRFIQSGLASLNGMVLWDTMYEESTDLDDYDIDVGSAYPTLGTAPANKPNLNDPRLKWRWRWHGLGVCDFDEERSEGVWGRTLVVPYWIVSVPLTLISGWFFLPNSTKSNEPEKEAPNP